MSPAVGVVVRSSVQLLSLLLLGVGVVVQLLSLLLLLHPPLLCLCQVEGAPVEKQGGKNPHLQM